MESATGDERHAWEQGYHMHPRTAVAWKKIPGLGAAGHAEF